MTPEFMVLRNRVTWQSKSIKSSPGKAEEIFTPRGTFWASLEPLRGAELFQAAQMKAFNAFRIVMRALPIRPQDRLVFETSGRVFTVVSAYRYEERNAFFIITATEIIS